MDMAKPIIRFKGYQDDWEQRKLGEISDSYSGGTPTAGKSEYYGGDIPFIRSAEVNSDSTELFLTDEGLKNSSAKMVNKGDILYALYGATSGETGLARLDGAINQAILDIKPHENYDAAFIMQWLRKSKENIIGTYLQGGQGNLSGSIVTSLMIDCPNHEEQKLIGEYFQNLDHLITLHQRKCDETKRLKKYMLQKMFPQNGKKVPEIRFSGFTDDWEQRKLGDICKMNGRIGFRGYTEKDIITKEAGGILTFSPTNIVDNQLTIGVKNTYITREKYNESPEIMVQKGNILFVKTGSTLGKSALVTGIEEDCTVNPQVVVIKVESNLQKILSVVLTSSPVQKQIAAVKIGGAVPTMTETELKNIDLALPQNVNERIKIGEYFENFDNLITLHQRELENLQNIKKFMLEKMFV